MFRFENPALLYALFAIVPFAALFVFYRFTRAKALKRFASGDSSLYKGVSPYKPYLRFALTMIAFASLTVAAANPQFGSKMRERETVGGDVAIALDISNSMLAEDARPNRLEAAKNSLMKFLDKLDGERVAVVVFAGEAFLQSPLTNDYGAVKLLIASAQPDQISSQGTALRAAIETSLQALEPSDKETKAILVISDGENHELDPVPAAEDAADANVKIYTVSYGSRDGATIPEYQNGVRTGFNMKDENGMDVKTAPNKTILKTISAATGGDFIDAGTGEVDLSSIVSALGSSRDKGKKTQIFTEYESIFQYFAAFSLALLFFERLFSDRKNKLITSLNLFGTAHK